MIKGMAIHLQILRVGIQLNNKRLENVSQAFLRYFVTAFQSNIFKTERFGIRFRLNLATCPPLRASVDHCPDARPTVATTWNTRLRLLPKVSAIQILLWCSRPELHQLGFGACPCMPIDRNTGAQTRCSNKCTDSPMRENPLGSELSCSMCDLLPIAFNPFKRRFLICRMSDPDMAEQ